MKKMVTVLFVVLMLLSSSVVSAECNLDTTRWRWVGSDSYVGLFYDKVNLKKLNNNLVEFWSCYYYPNGCKKHFYEHYHYCLTRTNYNDFTDSLRSVVVKDSNGFVVDSFNFYYDKFEPILPGSVAEDIVLKVKYDYGF